MTRRTCGDVVVLLPGITGSVLRRDGRDVWAVSPGAALQAVLSLGRSIQDLELASDDTDDGVTAPRLVSDVHLVPGLWKIDGYTKVRARLVADLGLVEGENYFDFPYDWRRDNRRAAQRLAEQAPRWLHDWRARSGNRDARLVLVGHSMGGLVARHYLEVLDGWQDTRALVTFGTPFRGSMNAVDFLVNGLRPGVGPLAVDLSRLLRSFTSVYQLVPTYRCVDAGSGLARVADTVLPHVDPARARAALAFHDEIRTAVEAHLQDDAYLRARYRISPVVGIYQPTSQSGVLEGGALRVLRSYEGKDYFGDGTVPQVSATPLELSDDPREVYVTEAHASLQNADEVIAHVVGVLSRPADLGQFKMSPLEGLSLEVADVLTTAEPVEVAAWTAGSADRVRLRVQDVDTRRVVRRRTLERRGSGPFRVTLPPLPAGVYRVHAEPPGDSTGPRPVTDLVTVIDPGAAIEPVNHTEG